MTDRKPLHLQSRFGIQVVVGSQRNLSFSNGTSIHRIIEYSLRKFVSMEIKREKHPNPSIWSVLTATGHHHQGSRIH